jgi:hypothetical protein
MRKLCLAAMVWALCLAAGPAAALELVDAAPAPDGERFALELRGSWLFEHRLQDAELKSTLGNRGLSFSEENRLAGVKLADDGYLLAAGVWRPVPRLSLHLGAGLAAGGDLEMGGSRGELETVFVWAVGAQGVLVESAAGLGLAAAAQYLRWDDRQVEGWRFHGRSAWGAYGYRTDDSADYWQVDGLLSLYWRRGWITPWLGLGYSYGELSYAGSWRNPANGAHITHSAEPASDGWVQAVAGARLELGRGFGLSLHAGFLNRVQAGLAVDWRF